MRVLFILMGIFGLLMADRQSEIKALYQEITENSREDYSDSINRLSNPFVRPAPKKAPVVVLDADSNGTISNTIQPVFQLKAILNDRARINNDWYRVGEQVSGYEITKINENMVLFRSVVDDGRSQKLKLSIQKNETLVIRRYSDSPLSKGTKP